MLPGKESQPQIKEPNCNAGGVGTSSCVIASEEEDTGHSCCDLLSTLWDPAPFQSSMCLVSSPLIPRGSHQNDPHFTDEVTECSMTQLTLAHEPEVKFAESA